VGLYVSLLATLEAEGYWSNVARITLHAR